MDQIKIGKFIAKERKDRGYTQKALSEILGISDKTISKWECGNGFPEVSLMLPLCNELEISVNELLTGERISELDYKNKAEENMVNMIKEREENTKKMKLTATIGVISTISFITIILVVSLYTEVISLPAKIILVLIACSIFVVGLYAAIQGERTIGYYKCNNCGTHFIPNFLDYSLGMHIFTTRKLKCPNCKNKSWCKKVMTKED